MRGGARGLAVSSLVRAWHEEELEPNHGVHPSSQRLSFETEKCFFIKKLFLMDHKHRHVELISRAKSGHSNQNLILWI